MKYMALDIGAKRIGFAVSDESGIIARPLTTLEIGSGLFEKIGEIVATEKPKVMIFGLPRHISGEEAEEVAQIKELAEGLKHEFGVEIDFEDETGTSIEAEKRLKERGIDFTKDKGLVDAEAATVILEAYLARS